MLSIILALLAAGPAAVCSFDGPQQDMNQCAHKRFLAADTELNIQWVKTADIMRYYDKNRDKKYDNRPGFLVTLRAAQRAWIIFRDQHCASVSYEARGGSMEAMLYGICREEQTRLRIAQLKILTSAEN